jgi:hypothetical protein
MKFSNQLGLECFHGFGPRYPMNSYPWYRGRLVKILHWAELKLNSDKKCSSKLKFAALGPVIFIGGC